MAVPSGPRQPFYVTRRRIGGVRMTTLYDAMGGADAVLAASVFHFGPDDAIAQVKKAIQDAGYPVR